MKLMTGGLVCLLIAAFFCYLYWVASRSDEATADWPTVMATVVASDVIEVVLGQESVSEANRTMRGGWENKIQYEYEVAGKTYLGNRISNQPIHEERDATDSAPTGRVDELRLKFTAGSKTEVHYHPEDPQVSYLVFTPSGGGTVQLVLGIGFVLIGIVLFLVGFKQ